MSAAELVCQGVGSVMREEQSPNTTAPVDPTEALPDQDLLPLYSRDEWVYRSCAARGGRLSHAAEFASLSRGLALRWSFFLLVR
jgi:hypothetical protein